MTIEHHPDVANLMSCSAGSQPEAFAAVMASHISMCKVCADRLRTMDDIGIALFEELPPAHLSKGAPTIAARANEAHGDLAHGADPAQDVPLPLVSVIGTQLSAIAWKRIGVGVWQHEIKLSPGAKGSLRLLKVAPGVAIPDHGHSGTELTLLLQGGYHDKLGHYRKGDVADLDSTSEHQPIADPDEGCICLVATEGKTRFKGLLARLVQPFIGM